MKHMAERTTKAEQALYDDPEFIEAKLDLLQAFLHEAETRQVTIWWHELDLLIHLARKANYEMVRFADDLPRVQTQPKKG